MPPVPLGNFGGVLQLHAWSPLRQSLARADVLRAAASLIVLQRRPKLRVRVNGNALPGSRTNHSSGSAPRTGFFSSSLKWTADAETGPGEVRFLATTLVDGGKRHGPPSRDLRGQSRGRARARDRVAWVGVQRSNHSGAGSTYEAISVARGMIGIIPRSQARTSWCPGAVPNRCSALDDRIP